MELLIHLLTSNGRPCIIKCSKQNPKDVSWFKKYKREKPSKDLSDLINLKIYQEYNLPKNWTSDDLELMTITLRDNDKMLDILYDIIRDLNPSLHIFDKLVKNETNFTFSKKYHILLGMGSLFNLDDIKEFIEGSVGYIKRQDPDYSMKNKFVEKKLKTYIQYVPSYKTMDIIYKHVLNN